jgi:hypothetical protein
VQCINYQCTVFNHQVPLSNALSCLAQVKLFCYMYFLKRKERKCGNVNINDTWKMCNIFTERLSYLVHQDEILKTGVTASFNNISFEICYCQLI